MTIWRQRAGSAPTQLGPASGHATRTSAHWPRPPAAIPGGPRHLDPLPRQGETEGTTAVVLFEQLDAEILTQGGAHALFVLAALVVHDGLEVGHLVRVLNLPEPVCRSVCRRLEGLGVLTSDAADQHYDIDLFWAPAVHRHLRRKHLLHRE